MGAMHMALLGPAGLEMLATRNAAAAMATKNALTSVEGISLAHPNSSHFNEFVISLPSSAKVAAASSKGIFVEKDLKKILGHLDSLPISKTAEPWVVQKYIEKPLLCLGDRKFDIRAWVLLTADYKICVKVHSRPLLTSMPERC